MCLLDQLKGDDGTDLFSARKLDVCIRWVAVLDGVMAAVFIARGFCHSMSDSFTRHPHEFLSVLYFCLVSPEHSVSERPGLYPS